MFTETLDPEMPNIKGVRKKAPILQQPDRVQENGLFTTRLVLAEKSAPHEDGRNRLMMKQLFKIIGDKLENVYCDAI